MANRLIKEQSPYLLQHAHNPVDWYPWGDEAFAVAEAQNKPVIVSIGYAACHWCHVMEHESFENEAVAAYMNENFVCIKVDREEHPDVDHLYMDAVQAINGNGGWPLNAFVTPGRVPFYGGTYYPPQPAYGRPSWMQLLARMREIWHNQQDEVVQQSEQMVQFLRNASKQLAASDKGDWTTKTCEDIAASLLRLADKEKGGFGNAPKFPGTMAINYLLNHFHFYNDGAALQQALLSLDAMADGGIYDQLGGGFARYSTDRDWLAPHFEKMLYDNALLIVSYSNAFALTANPRYKSIIDETITFIERELKDETGGYYCALDADSEGVEGKFYTWTYAEWQACAGADRDLFAGYFGIEEGGNWEHTNILHVAGNLAQVAHESGLEMAEVEYRLEALKVKLFTERAKRIRPATDDKCLLSWNALMNAALTKAGRTLGNKEYMALAEKHMDWMKSSFNHADGLKHTWKGGAARIVAKVDDYAYLINAMLMLASATGDMGLLTEAIGLTEQVIADFSQEESYFYFTPASSREIPVRKVDVYDGATPSANAVMAENLWICGMCAERTEWIERSKKMLGGQMSNAVRNAYSYAWWAGLTQCSVNNMKISVCTGIGAEEASNSIFNSYNPHVFSIFQQENHENPAILKNKFSPNNLSIFVCSEEACQSPVSVAEQAIRMLKQKP